SNHGSFLWGFSTHNTRIECLWVEVGYCEIFVEEWNHHPISGPTTQHQSPLVSRGILASIFLLTLTRIFVCSLILRTEFILSIHCMMYTLIYLPDTMVLVAHHCLTLMKKIPMCKLKPPYKTRLPVT
ncbi:hypothetical protein DFJ58DRAFT_668602, partial [Suillus subalutaceus]|uniref:uncharacterized protein n=1 Tax=Suillus subalutaceus TaxID=48586 RepID=UPI001B86236F